MNFGVFVAAIAGTAFGGWFFISNKQFLMSLVYSFRLIVDPSYRNACLDLMESPNFYATAKPQFDILPRSQHHDAITRTRDHLDSSLVAYYRVVLKHLGIQGLIYGIIPLLLFAIFGTTHYFLASVAVALSFACMYELLFMNRHGYVFYTRLRTLMSHAYADAGYRPRVARPMQAHQQEKPVIAQIAKPLPSRIIPAKPVSALTTTSSTVQVDADGDDDIVIPEALPKKIRKISLSTVWWGTDALICFGIIIAYWITDAGGLLDILIMPLLLIVFVQVFFIPVWFVIKIAHRLLEPKQAE